jgi:hypothetical protein
LAEPVQVLVDVLGQASAPLEYAVGGFGRGVFNGYQLNRGFASARDHDMLSSPGRIDELRQVRLGVHHVHYHEISHPDRTDQTKSTQFGFPPTVPNGTDGLSGTGAL